MHGGGNHGPPVGNTNALRHGHYTAQAIAARRGTRTAVKRQAQQLQRLVQLMLVVERERPDRGA